MAKLANFYGFSHRELRTMRASKVQEYWQAINPIEAKNALAQLKIVCYPHASKSDRKKFYDFLYNEAYPNKVSGKALKVEDFMKLAQAKGLNG